MCLSLFISLFICCHIRIAFSTSSVCLRVHAAAVTQLDKLMVRKMLLLKYHSENNSSWSWQRTPLNASASFGDKDMKKTAPTHTNAKLVWNADFSFDLCAVQPLCNASAKKKKMC